MALLPIPVWTVPPDWASPVSEPLEWLTGVFASRTGAEQRQRLRLSPRRSFEFTVTAFGVWRTYLDALLSTTFQNKFYLPVWHEVSRLVSAASSGDVWITIQGSRIEFVNAQVVILRGDAPYQYELVEVTSVTTVGDNIQLNLPGPLNFDWQRGTRVHPVVPARLAQQPQYTRVSDNAVQTSVRFDVTMENDWPDTVDLPEYRDFPVMEFQTNEADTQSGSYFRLADTIDNQVGIPYHRDVGGFNFPIVNSANFVHGRQDGEALRALLYTLQGRLAPFWSVLPQADFKIRLPFLSGDTEIVVERSGFTDLGGPVEGRQDIRIKLHDGTSIYRRILSSTIRGDAITERLVLDSALGVEAAPREVTRISFMALARLDQDTIELSHVTDGDGVCNVSFAIKGVPTLRTGEDWFPPPFPLNEFGDCGPTVPGRFWARRNDGLWNNDPAADPSIGTGGVDVSSIEGPLYPLGTANTGLFAGQLHTFNFGGSPFAETVPLRAAAWGVTTTFNSSDKGANVILETGNLSFSLQSEVTGEGVRATSNSSTQFGLRYYEVVYPGTVTSADIVWKDTPPAMSQDSFAGFANSAYDVSGSSLAHSVVVNKDGSILVNGLFSGISVGSIAVGDTISLLVYTGSG